MPAAAAVIPVARGPARAIASAASSLAIVAAPLLAACRSREQPHPATYLRDRTPTSGVDFRHHRCATGQKLIVEITGAGVSLLDHDGDGDLDLFCCQGAPLPGFDGKGLDLRDHLYRNDGDFHFTDVTEATGATDAGYTFAAMAPDLDGDGDQDLYLCNVERDTVLRNDGGRFTDVTASCGPLDCDLWTTAAAFVDLDADGDLDCYLCNYLLEGTKPKECGIRRDDPKTRTYCRPSFYPPAPDRLLRNDGGAWVDVSEQGLLGERLGSGLAVVPCDYDDDRDVDLFVSNDGLPNYLWRNEGGMRFTEVATSAGVAVNGAGAPEACMGADFSDVEHDGDFDLLVANFAFEGNTFYRNEGDGLFDDWSVPSNLGPPSLPYVGFGNRFFDFDHDGDDDSLVVNGHVIEPAALENPIETFEQPPLFMLNDGKGRFTEAGGASEPWLSGRYLARALATGDLDGDGDLDAVVGINDGRPFVLENQVGQERSWIGIRLRARGKDTFAMGARVTIEAGGERQRNEVRGSNSFGAWQELVVRFGLADKDHVDRGWVRWPDGRETEIGRLEARRVHTLVEPEP